MTKYQIIEILEFMGIEYTDYTAIGQITALIWKNNKQKSVHFQYDNIGKEPTYTIYNIYYCENGKIIQKAP